MVLTTGWEWGMRTHLAYSPYFLGSERGEMRGRKQRGTPTSYIHPFSLFIGKTSIIVHIYTPLIHNIIYIFIRVNYNDLTATSLEIMVNKGNHPQMALIQLSEILQFT